MSLSGDTMMTMPVVPSGMTGSGNSGFGGFGGDGAWWIIILFLFVFCGWGRGGNGGGQGGYDTRADIQRGFDNSAVITKLDGITNGICDSTYALNNTMTTGFSNAELSRCNQQAAIMQQLNNMAMQAQGCCCDIREAIQGVNYNMATQSCDTRNTIQNATRDIIDSQNSGIQAVMGKLSQMEYNNLNDKYQTVLAENQALRFQASQTAQNAFINANQEAQTAELLRRLGRDCPVPVPCNPCGNSGSF